MEEHDYGSNLVQWLNLATASAHSDQLSESAFRILFRLDRARQVPLVVNPRGGNLVLG